MKRINFNCSDAEECISGFRRLSESLRSDADSIRRAAAAGDVSENFSEAEKILSEEAQFAEEVAVLTEKAVSEYEETEERVKALLRKHIFQQHGDVIVEKSKEYDEGELLFTHALKHEDEQSRLVISKISKEQKR